MYWCGTDSSAECVFLRLLLTWCHSKSSSDISVEILLIIIIRRWWSKVSVLIPYRYKLDTECSERKLLRLLLDLYATFLVL